MALHRRTLLRGGGVVAAASLSGCSALAELLAGQQQYEYTLTVDPVDRPLLERTLFDPADASPFERAARDALEAVLPEGRHTTVGFEPVPADAYVEHDGRYYQIKVVVTGRETRSRRLVRATPLESGPTHAAERSLDELPSVSRRIVEALHRYHASDGRDAPEGSLRGGAYVLRRPAELADSVVDALAGEFVRVDGGRYRYRLFVSEERVTEPVYESFAAEVAPDRAGFHDVALATRVDAVVEPSTLNRAERDLLETAIDDGRHSEQTPLSEPFSALIERLGVADVTVSETGRSLWYDGSLYRYGLHVHPLE